MASMKRPFLLDPPRPGIDQLPGVLLLDVDGVLNILDPEVDRGSLPIITGISGRPQPINMVSDAVLEQLDGVLSDQVRIGWLTSWGFRVERLEPLLGGRLAGGFVVTERPSTLSPAADWKLQAVVHFRVQNPGVELAWADDDAALYDVEPGGNGGYLENDLLVTPAPHVGLSQSDASRIAAHLQEKQE